MTEHIGIDPAEAAQITRDIRDTLGFLEDLIDDPTPVAQIPSGSTLVFRNIRVLDERFRLTAFRPSGSDEVWSSRVTTHVVLGDVANARPPVNPPNETRSARLRSLPNQEPDVRHVVMRGETAYEALDTLEAVLQKRALLQNYPMQSRHRR